MNKLLAAFIVFAFVGCERADVETDCVEKINPNVACPMIYAPVCGCNGKTYGNDCVAQASGIRVVAKGECGGNQ